MPLRAYAMLDPKKEAILQFVILAVAKLSLLTTLHQSGMDAYVPLKRTQYGGNSAKTIGKDHQYFRSNSIADEASDARRLPAPCNKIEVFK
mmetsp:Transcript_13300/g.26705  ORF Transcript_13300/g.26705 Transcript_13300/m.26705 type:complete len:91 (+) Transcript_13300:421-693(+)